MSASEPTHRPAVSISEAASEVFEFDGWTVHEFQVVASTNLLAASLPVWHAVRAATQTAGRGRFQRTWVSDSGGLWLSAVVPASPDFQRLLPLAIGCAVCRALKAIGVKSLRMRWPNDILADDLKLAGLLIDRFRPGSAVAGIGLNVSNQPHLQDKNLARQFSRLADLLPGTALELRHLSGLVLRALRAVVTDLTERTPRPLLEEINGLWGPPRPVELDLDGPRLRGTFHGVNDEGSLILETEDRQRQIFSANQVRHLTEICSSSGSAVFQRALPEELSKSKPNS